MAVKSAQEPPARNAATARYRHARKLLDLLEPNWQRSQWRDEPLPTFRQVEAVLLADDAQRARDGEPMRWGV